MTDSRWQENMERKLDDHGKKLDSINQTLQRIAVQDERIKNAESDITALWAKYDALTDPNTGQMKRVSDFQASCPRAQVKTLWVVVIPMGLALLGMTYKLLTT